MSVIGTKVKWDEETDMDPSHIGVVVDQREDGWLGVCWNESHTIYSPVDHLAPVPPPAPPVDPAPVDPAPVDPAPVDPAPVDPAPVDPAPVDPADDTPKVNEPLAGGNA